jgi:hypothetical protein
VKEVSSSLAEWENWPPAVDYFGKAGLIAADPWRRSLCPLCMMIWLTVLHSAEDLLELPI